MYKSKKCEWHRPKVLELKEHDIKFLVGVSGHRGNSVLGRLISYKCYPVVVPLVLGTVKASKKIAATVRREKFMLVCASPMETHILRKESSGCTED